MGLQGFIERRLEKDPNFLSHFWFYEKSNRYLHPHTAIQYLY